jgi:hypothetical protein
MAITGLLLGLLMVMVDTSTLRAFQVEGPIGLVGVVNSSLFCLGVTFIGYVVFKEHPTIFQVVGVVRICVGISMVTLFKH